MRATLVLFAAALAVRLLAWATSPERAAPFEAIYQGDAPYWQAAARGAGGLELVLPFRPPAMPWLAALTWNGDPATAWWPRLLLVVGGAAIAPLVFAIVRRMGAPRVAWIAGAICALSGSLQALGTGIHGELPYVLLFLLTMPDYVRLSRQPAPLVAARWSGLHALACLVRADHLLCWLVSLAWLLRRPSAQRLRDAAIAVGAFAAVLAPWQLHAMAVTADYNARGADAAPPAAPPQGSLPWDQEAIAAVVAMPAFARAATFGFVDATVRARGGTRVAGRDLAVLDEAYGARPEPLPMPLIALYGPLNFFLANSAEATAGFSRRALDRRPPLAGGLSRYPPGLLDVLPRDGDLNLSYPPHLQATVHGYRLGWRWIASNPLAALQRVGWRLAQFWAGAATGVGACNLPLGRSGIREPVDLTVANGGVAVAWRCGCLLLAALGWWRLRALPGSAGFVLFGAALAAVDAAFFGYARLGAAGVPAFAVLWAAALDAMFARASARSQRRVLIALGIAVVVAEVTSAMLRTPPLVDGVAFSQSDPTSHRRVVIQY
jgi:hypothetical protein